MSPWIPPPDRLPPCAGFFRPNKAGPLHVYHEAAAKRSSPGQLFLQRRNDITPAPIQARRRVWIWRIQGVPGRGVKRQACFPGSSTCPSGQQGPPQPLLAGKDLMPAVLV